MTELERLKEENRKLRELVCFNVLLPNPYLSLEQKKIGTKVLAKGFDVDNVYRIMEKITTSFSYQMDACCCVKIPQENLGEQCRSVPEQLYEVHGRQ